MHLTQFIEIMFQDSSMMNTKSHLPKNVGSFKKKKDYGSK
jgi:hypothetical protein